MTWLLRLLGSSRGTAGAPGGGSDRPGAHPPAAGPIVSDAFFCGTCGRTDLPEAGGWDPPICLECDAEINFAAIEEVEITQEW